jgi:ATP-binding cassette, subfamily C (CFTR/MRP), member 1
MRQFPQSGRTQTPSSTDFPRIELSPLPQPVSSPFLGSQRDVIISMKIVNFGWKASPPDRTGITLTLQSSPTGDLVAIVGPVGSGKSTFLKGVVGETHVLQGKLFWIVVEVSNWESRES